MAFNLLDSSPSSVALRMRSFCAPQRGQWVSISWPMISASLRGAKVCDQLHLLQTRVNGVGRIGMAITSCHAAEATRCREGGK